MGAHQRIPQRSSALREILSHVLVEECHQSNAFAMFEPYLILNKDNGDVMHSNTVSRGYKGVCELELEQKWDYAAVVYFREVAECFYPRDAKHARKVGSLKAIKSEYFQVKTIEIVEAIKFIEEKRFSRSASEGIESLARGNAIVSLDLEIGSIGVDFYVGAKQLLCANIVAITASTLARSSAIEAKGCVQSISAFDCSENSITSTILLHSSDKPLLEFDLKSLIGESEVRHTAKLLLQQMKFVLKRKLFLELAGLFADDFRKLTDFNVEDKLYDRFKSVSRSFAPKGKFDKAGTTASVNAKRQLLAVDAVLKRFTILVPDHAETSKYNCMIVLGIAKAQLVRSFKEEQLDSDPRYVGFLVRARGLKGGFAAGFDGDVSNMQTLGIFERLGADVQVKVLKADQDNSLTTPQTLYVEIILSAC
jgi:hypothetical protein